MSKQEALKALREVLGHLIDYGKIEIGTPQSRNLILAAKALGAYAKETNR